MKKITCALAIDIFALVDIQLAISTYLQLYSRGLFGFRYHMRETQAAKNLLFRRLRCLANYENANKSLDKARARNKDVPQAEGEQQVVLWNEQVRSCQKSHVVSLHSDAIVRLMLVRPQAKMSIWKCLPPPLLISHLLVNLDFLKKLMTCTCGIEQNPIVPMWLWYILQLLVVPGLVKFHHFGQIFKVFGKFSRVYVVFGRLLNLLWEFLWPLGIFSS